MRAIGPYDEKERGQETILNRESFTKWLVGVKRVSARARTRNCCILPTESAKSLKKFKQQAGLSAPTTQAAFIFEQNHHS